MNEPTTNPNPSDMRRTLDAAWAMGKPTKDTPLWQPGDKEFLDSVEQWAREASDKPREGANSTQVGGQHYKSRPIEPWDYCAANNLDGFQMNIIKYVTRWEKKRGVEDLRKARHFLDKYIELAEHGYPNTDLQYFIDLVVHKHLQMELHRDPAAQTTEDST